MPGAHLHCACGWKPCSEAGPGQRHGQAERHWRDCHGSKPPRAGSAGKLASQLAAHRSLRAGARRRAEETYAAWLEERPDEAKEASCELDFNDASTSEKASQAYSRYRCRRCGNYKDRHSAKRYPCRKRPNKHAVPLRNVLIAALGAERADKQLKGSRARGNRHKATAGAKLKARLSHQKRRSDPALKAHDESVKRRWEQSNRQRINARAKEKRGRRTPEQVAHPAAVTKAYKVKNRDKLRRQAAAYRRRKEETEGRGAH